LVERKHVTTVLRVLVLVTLLLGVALTAVAWRDGLPNYQCGCSCDRDGNQIPAQEYFDRQHADDDRPTLLIFALLTTVLGGAVSLIGVIVPSARGRFFAVTFGGSIVLGVAMLLSIIKLAPCAGY